jgi:hypothetical protein
MENSSTIGALGRRILAWILVGVVALFVLKIAFGFVLGLVQAVFTIALIVFVVLGALWALRHL